MLDSDDANQMQGLCFMDIRPVRLLSYDSYASTAPIGPLTSSSYSLIVSSG